MTRTLLFIPMYNCERQIIRVLNSIDPEIALFIDHVLVIDNGSSDYSVRAAAEALAHLPMPGTVLRNHQNYNLGGNHKVAFDYAIAGNYDHVVVLHGDDQADINDVVPMLAAGLHHQMDCLLGSRFSSGSRRTGYSRFRTFGNLVFNGLFSCVTGRLLVDLGSGLNVFSVSWLRSRFWIGFADDLTFNNHLLLAMVNRRARFAFFPISWREEDQRSNVRLFSQAGRTLVILIGYGALRGYYLGFRHALREPDSYTASVIYRSNPAETDADTNADDDPEIDTDTFEPLAICK